MPTPAIQTLLTDAQQVLNLNSLSEVRATMAAALANANVGTPLNPNLTTQQLWDEFYLIVRQPESDIESIITNQLMKFLFAPPAPGGAGANTQVIFNDNGVLAGDAGLTYNKTTDALTITGDLTVDTNVLKVDTTNNRVGIGTASPANQLSVRNEGASGISVIDIRGGTGGAGALQISGNGTTLGTTSFNFIQNGAGAFINNQDATPLAFSVNGAERYNIGTTGISTWSVAGTTAMTLNSTGLGVGGPAVSRLTLGADTNTDGSNKFTFYRGGTSGQYSVIENTGGTVYRSYGTGGHFFYINNGTTEAFRVDTSGNVGIGGAASAWGSAFKAIQQVNYGTSFFSSNAGSSGLASNCYNDGTNWLYSSNNPPTRYEFGVDAGNHRWFSAAAGTGTISFGDAKMTLDASGNLLVGSALPVSGGRISGNSSSGPAGRFFSSAGDNQFAAMFDKSSVTNTTSQWLIGFTINNQTTGSGQINANGASQAAFGTFSDSRLKENILSLPSQLASILSLRPVEFDYKDGSGHQIGFIAQEMQEVYSDTVSEQNGFLTVTGWSKTEARLVSAIKELAAKVQALEAKLA